MTKKQIREGVEDLTTQCIPAMFVISMKELVWAKVVERLVDDYHVDPGLFEEVVAELKKEDDAMEAKPGHYNSKPVLQDAILECRQEWKEMTDAYA